VLSTQAESILGDEELGSTVSVRVGCHNFRYVHTMSF
jgi:hypothetical protein